MHSLAGGLPSSWFLLACAAGTVLLLLVLIARVRLHPALALAVSAFALGIAAGMPLSQVPVSFTAGVGGLMGHIAIVLGLGAILGRLLASSGGATALGSTLVERCGERGLPWALLALGILVGMPVFFEVGLVLMMPIIAAAARRSGQSADSRRLAHARGTLHRARHHPSASRRPCSPPRNTTQTSAAPSFGASWSAFPPASWLDPCSQRVLTRLWNGGQSRRAFRPR